MVNKQRNKSSTDSKFMYMNNINITMLFIVTLSDYVLSIFIFWKTFNGTLLTCYRFILKIFFYGVNRMYM